MKLIIKQKIISWFDSYNVYDEYDNVVYTVKGKLSWGHKFLIYDTLGREVGCIRQKIWRLLPTFEICQGGCVIGQVCQKLTAFRPRFHCDLGDYEVDGNVWGLHYRITKGGTPVATIDKKFLSWSDTYTIDVCPEDAFYILMIAVAIDAAFCSRNNS